MSKKVEQYQHFFLDQIREAEIERKNLMNTPISQLLRREEILIGYVSQVNEQSGHVILKFPKNKAPRLKVQKSIMVIRKGAKAEFGQNIYDWNCSFLDFCKKSEFHSPSSSLIPHYYIKSNDTSYDYLACTGISVSLFDLFKKTTASGKSLTILIYAPFPPIDYFNNLANFLELYQHLPEQLLEAKIDYDDWRPEELAYNPNNNTAISGKIMETLDSEDCCVLQGPPGTGKSYTIAHIIAEYLSKDKTVCVTTMANKGLIELVKQPPLKQFLEDGRISKTNLSSDERKMAQGLKSVENGFIVPKGKLLCSTNYVLSQVYNVNNTSDCGLPNYDLIIIEEASQAFLASILAFKQLGKKCLIVGDPMQLPPIITKENKNIYKAWNVNTQIEGLKTYALGTDVKSYKITTTFRLTPASALLTGIFYNNHFTSVQQKSLDFSKCTSTFFPKDGGVIFHNTKNFTNGVLSEKALDIISTVLSLIANNYPTRSLAIISPFNETIKLFQKSFYTDSRIEDLTIETIDRIQGMTVDYAILYIPGRNAKFALDERRFNVATSRSRSTTLVITDTPITNLYTIPPKVSHFIRNCTQIDSYPSSISNKNTRTNLLSKDCIKIFYPGLEHIVDLLIDNNITFSHDGDVDLLDSNDVVIASAGMILREYRIAIDPTDCESKTIFERAGYRIIDSNSFTLDILNR
ncbi:MAG: AAA domain-containing protein [Phocaeicola sp.]